MYNKTWEVLGLTTNSINKKNAHILDKLKFIW